jgi:uncharacterized MAPEG superfamily protein
MKKISIFMLLAAVFCCAACSRSDKQDSSSAQPTPTPNQNLQRDAERLQQATANVAKERERAAQMSPQPTASP